MQTIKAYTIDKMYKMTTGILEKDNKADEASLSPSGSSESSSIADTGPAPPLAPTQAQREKYLSMKRARIDEDTGSAKQKGSKKVKKSSKKSKDKHCIQKTTMKAIIKELIGNDMTISADAERILHQVGEDHLTEMFENAEILSKLNGRKTVSLPDVRGVLALNAENFVAKKAILLQDDTFHSLGSTPTEDPSSETAHAETSDADSLKSSEEEEEEEDDGEDNGEAVGDTDLEIIESEGRSSAEEIVGDE